MAQTPSARERQGGSRSRMADVARLAGVSTATVSRALRQPNAVSPEFRARIDDAIARLSYRPNLMAGALASARSMTIGVIIPSIINSFFAATVEAMETGLAGSGYQIMLGNSGYSAEMEEQLVTSFLAWSPAAMVLTGKRHSRATIRALIAADMPVVEMWELSDQPIDAVVGFSQQGAGRIVASHFCERGARRIGTIGAAMDRDYRAAERHRGFVEGALEAGYDPPTHVQSPERASAVVGARGLAELMALDPAVDAVFCTNDILALGCLFEAQRRGWRVPDQIKLCGFGDLDFSEASAPGLTTVRPPRRKIGAKVAEILRARLTGGGAPGGVFDLGFELVVRGST